MSVPDVVVNDFENLFINDDSGALGRITGVDNSYAYLEVLLPEPSHYSIPIAEYDSTWAELWRPAQASDLAALGGKPSTYRRPENAAQFWGPEETS